MTRRERVLCFARGGDSRRQVQFAVQNYQNIEHGCHRSLRPRSNVSANPARINLQARTRVEGYLILAVLTAGHRQHFIAATTSPVRAKAAIRTKFSARSLPTGCWTGAPM